jgi:hypothetical protein
MNWVAGLIAAAVVAWRIWAERWCVRNIPGYRARVKR